MVLLFVLKLWYTLRYFQGPNFLSAIRTQVWTALTTSKEAKVTLSHK